MATEPNNDPALQTEKVTYTPEQQAHMQTIIDAAVARSNKTHTAELETERANLARISSELEAAKVAARSSKKPEDDAALQAEIERIRLEHKTALDEANAKVAERTAETLKARTEATEVRKEVAIQNAASKVPFVDIAVVLKLTKDQVQIDPETGRFVVHNDNGQPRLNASFEPMSLDEFFVDYAAKNKFLVRGNMNGGAGSTEGSRSDLSKNGRYELAEIFGPKSDSKKATALFKSDPTEYRRMRVIAKENGLVV